MNGTGVVPLAADPSEFVKLTERVNDVPIGAVWATVMPVLRPFSVVADIGAFTGSEDTHTGIPGRVSVIVFPDASTGVASKVANCPGTIPLTGC